MMKYRTLSSKIRKERRVSTFISPIHHCTGGPNCCNTARKTKKDWKNNTKQVKVFSLQDTITLYVKNPKVSTKLLSLIGDFIETS